MSATHRNCNLRSSRGIGRYYTKTQRWIVIKEPKPLPSLREFFSKLGILRRLQAESRQQLRGSSRLHEKDSHRLHERESHHLYERPLTVRYSKPKTILQLPLELFLHVVSFLSIDVVASLALTCRAFYQIIGAQPFEELNGKDNILQKVRFLQYMVDDFPYHALCSSCAVFHKIRRSHDRVRGRLCRLDNYCIGLCTNRHTSSVDRRELQLNLGLLTIDWASAMSAARAHRHTSRTQSRSQYDTNNSSLFDSDLARGTKIDGIYHSIRARLWHDHIIIRMTSCVPLSLHFHSSSLYHLYKPFPLLTLCRHMCNIIKDDLAALLYEARKTPPEYPPGIGPTFIELESARSFCRFCPSEYKAHAFRSLDIDHEVTFSTRHPYVLILERWIDLGRSGSEPSREFEALVKGQICCDDEDEQRFSHYNRKWKRPLPHGWGWGRDWPNMISISSRYHHAEKAMQ